MPLAVVDKKLVALGIVRPVGGEVSSLRRFAARARHAAVDGRQVQRAVEVEVNQDRAEAGAAPARREKSGQSGGIVKETFFRLMPQRVSFFGEVGDEDVEA